MTNQFSSAFSSYAFPGDSITAEVDGFDITASIEPDIDADAPDENQDGFWPSLDPKDAGFIGEGKTQADLKLEQEKAESIMRAWRNDEWFYCGIVLSVSKAGITLVNYAASLWSVECNFPGSDNSYLTEVANELLDEALTAGKAALAKLCAA